MTGIQLYERFAYMKISIRKIPGITTLNRKRDFTRFFRRDDCIVCPPDGNGNNTEQKAHFRRCALAIKLNFVILSYYHGKYKYYFQQLVEIGGVFTVSFYRFICLKAISAKPAGMSRPIAGTYLQYHSVKK